MGIRGYFKFISVVVIFALLVQDLAFANSSLGIFQQAITQSFNQGPENYRVLGKPLQLPAGSGKIIRTFESKSPAPVFLIQDAHFHLEAQENAAAAITQLINQYDINMVGLEGASGELWHDWATRYPDENARKKVFRFLLERHEIGAAEYAISQVKNPVRLFGLENKDLYHRHLDIARLASTRREEMKARLTSWNRILRGLQSQVMPPAYLEYTSSAQSSLEDFEHMKFLLESAKKHRVDLAPFPQIQAFARVEDGMDKIGGVDLMREFRRVQDMDIRVGLLNLALKSSASGLDLLKKKMKNRGYEESFPKLMRWLELISLTSQLDEKLMTEFQALDQGMRRSFLKTEEQKWLEQVSQWTLLFEKWQKLEWLPEDAALYERDHNRIFSGSVIAQILSFSDKYRVEMGGQDWKALFDRSVWAPWLEYYVLALKRDAELAVETEKMVRLAGAKPVLIYAGGFHTPGLERELRSRKISFVTVRPVIHRTQEKVEKVAYEKALEGRDGFFEKILKQSLRRAASSNRIPFELQTPRRFPGSGQLTNMEQVFKTATRSILATVNQGVVTNDRVVVENLNVRKNGLSANVFTPDGEVGVNIALTPEGERIASASLTVQISTLSLDERPSQPTTLTTTLTVNSGSLGNLLPPNLLPGSVGELSFKEPDVSISGTEKRSETRRFPSLSFLIPAPVFYFSRWLKVVITAFMAGGAMASAAEGTAQVIQKPEDVQSLMTAVQKIVDVQASGVNIGPGTSANIASHLPQADLIRDFQEAYMKVHGEDSLNYGADGIWGYENSETDNAFNEVLAAVKESGGAAEKFFERITGSPLPEIQPAPVTELVPAAPTSITPKVPVSTPEVSIAKPMTPEVAIKVDPVGAPTLSNSTPPASAVTPSTESMSQPSSTAVTEVPPAVPSMKVPEPQLIPPAVETPKTIESDTPVVAPKVEGGVADVVETPAESVEGMKETEPLQALKEWGDWAVSTAKNLIEGARHGVTSMWDQYGAPLYNDIGSAILNNEWLSQHPDIQTFLHSSWPYLVAASILALLLVGNRILRRVFRSKQRPSVGLIPSEELRTTPYLKALPALEKVSKKLDADGIRALFKAIEQRFPPQSNAEVYDEIVPAEKVKLYDYMRSLNELTKSATNSQSQVKVRSKAWMGTTLEIILGLAGYFIFGFDLILLLKIATAFHLAWTGYFFVNEVGHVATSLSLGHFKITSNKIFGHSIGRWMLSLIPGMPLIFGAEVSFPEASKSKMRLIRWLGWGFSTAVAVLAIYAFFPAIVAFLPMSWAGAAGIQGFAFANAGFLASSVTLWLSMYGFIFAAASATLIAFFSDVVSPPLDPNKACCGNEIQVLDFKDKDIDLDEQIRYLEEELYIMEQLDVITAVRGGQAKGGRIYLKTKDGKTIVIDIKILVGRRRDVSEEWQAELRKQLRMHLRANMKKLESVDSITFHMHIRFGTSSRPAIIETHPFTFDKPLKVKYRYQDSDGKWQVKIIDFQNLISHNGDNDSFFYFEDGSVGSLKKLDHNQQGMWLQSVLDIDNVTLGDSPKLAGLMDLFHTKGMWHPSFRLAFQDVVAKSFEAAFKDNVFSNNPKDRAAPTRKEIAAFSEAWEAYFDAQLEGNPKATEKQIAGWIQVFINLPTTKKDFSFVKRIPDESIQAFAARSAYVFMNNDLYAATTMVQQREEGSFGFVTSDTLDPTSIVFSSVLQPLTIAFSADGNRYTVISEKLGAQALRRNGEYAYEGRYDLAQTKGEIFAVDRDEQGRFRVRGRNLITNNELTEADIRVSGNYVPIADNPNLQTVGDNLMDPDSWIPRDLESIPKAFKKLDESFLDDQPNGKLSENQQSTMEAWNLMLLQWVESQLMEFSIGESKQFKAQGRPMRRFVKNIILGIAKKVEARQLSKEGLREAIILARNEIIERMNKKDEAEKEAETAPIILDEFQKKERPVKMVIAGVENSLDTAKLAMSTMKLQFGSYDVRAVDSNILLRSFNEAHIDGAPVRIGGEGDVPFFVDQGTIFIFISSTGGGFGTANGAAGVKDWQELERRVDPLYTQWNNLNAVAKGRVIAVANKDTLLASIVGQKSYPGAEPVGRLIQPFPGVDNVAFHPSEISTVAQLAQNRTVTHLMLQLGWQASGMGDLRPFGFNQSEAMVLKQVAALTGSREHFSAIVGHDEEGKPLTDQSVHKKVKKAMDDTRSHIFESPLKWFSGKVYSFFILVGGSVLMFYHFGNIFLPSVLFFGGAPSSLAMALAFGLLDFGVVAAFAYTVVMVYRLYRVILKSFAMHRNDNDLKQIKNSWLYVLKLIGRAVTKAEYNRILVSQTLPGVAIVESPLIVNTLWQYWNKLFSDAPSPLRVFAQRLTQAEAPHYGPPMVNTATHIFMGVPDGRLLGLMQAVKAAWLFAKQADGIGSLAFRFLEDLFGVSRISPNIMTISQDGPREQGENAPNVNNQRNLFIENNLAAGLSLFKELADDLKKKIVDDKGTSKITDEQAEAIRKTFDKMHFQSDFYHGQVDDALALIGKILSSLDLEEIFRAKNITADFFRKQKDLILFFEYSVAAQLRAATFYVAAYEVARETRKIYDIFRIIILRPINIALKGVTFISWLLQKVTFGLTPVIHIDVETGKWSFATASKVRTATTASPESAAPFFTTIRKVLHDIQIKLNPKEDGPSYKGTLPFHVVTSDQGSFREFMFTPSADKGKGGKSSQPPLSRPLSDISEPSTDFALLRLAIGIGRGKLKLAESSAQLIPDLKAWAANRLDPLVDDINKNVLAPANSADQQLVEELLALQITIRELGQSGVSAVPPAETSAPSAPKQEVSGGLEGNLRKTLALGENYLLQKDSALITRWLGSHADKFEDRIDQIGGDFLDLQFRMLTFINEKAAEPGSGEEGTDTPNRAELRTPSPLEKALGESADMNNGLTARSEARKLSELLTALGKRSFMTALEADETLEKKVVVLVNPDIDLVRATAATGKQVVVLINGADDYAAREKQLRLGSTGLERVTFVVGETLEALKQVRDWQSNDMLQIGTSKAVDEMAKDQRTKLVADLLGATSESVVIYGDNQQQLRGVRRVSILDQFEHLMLMIEMTSRSA